jgi:hypothetical protein
MLCERCGETTTRKKIQTVDRVHKFHKIHPNKVQKQNRV